MAEIADANVKRYTYTGYGDTKSQDRFCLLSVAGYESDNPEINRKRDDLLRRLAGEFNTTSQILECTIGGCDVAIVDDLRKGEKSSTGVCKASSYCLKVVFEAVGSGDAEYSDVLDTCEGRSSKYSAGNFCPQIDCDLSAGVSIDMVPGTVGECVIEIRSPQGRLF